MHDFPSVSVKFSGELNPVANNGTKRFEIKRVPCLCKYLFGLMWGLNIDSHKYLKGECGDSLPNFRWATSRLHLKNRHQLILLFSSWKQLFLGFCAYFLMHNLMHLWWSVGIRIHNRGTKTVNSSLIRHNVVFYWIFASSEHLHPTIETVSNNNISGLLCLSHIAVWIRVFQLYSWFSKVCIPAAFDMPSRYTS